MYLNASSKQVVMTHSPLVGKVKYYDANFIRQDPRVVKYN